VADIYREVPCKRVTVRVDELRRGIEKYLGRGEGGDSKRCV
jgi:hypothetical protein